MTSEQIREKARELWPKFWREIVGFKRAPEFDGGLNIKNAVGPEQALDFSVFVAESLYPGRAQAHKVSVAELHDGRFTTGNGEPASSWAVFVDDVRVFDAPYQEEADGLAKNLRSAIGGSAFAESLLSGGADSGTPAEAAFAQWPEIPANAIEMDALEQKLKEHPVIKKLSASMLAIAEHYHWNCGLPQGDMPSCKECGLAAGWIIQLSCILAGAAPPAASPQTETRFDDFDDPTHPAFQWFDAHGQYMRSGGGRNEYIWACRGWIAREQLLAGVPVTGDSLTEKSLRERQRAASGGQPAQIRLLIHNALTLAKKALWAVTLHAPNYDWNSDPIAITPLMGSASQAIDAALAVAAPDLGPLAASQTPAISGEEAWADEALLCKTKDQMVTTLRGPLASAEIEMRKALNCLRLEVAESIAADVEKRFNAFVEAVNSHGLLGEAEAALVSCKDMALLAIPSAIGFTREDLQKIAFAAEMALARIRVAKEKHP